MHAHTHACTHSLTHSGRHAAHLAMQRLFSVDAGVSSPDTHTLDPICMEHECVYIFLHSVPYISDVCIMVVARQFTTSCVSSFIWNTQFKSGYGKVSRNLNRSDINGGKMSMENAEC